MDCSQAYGTLGRTHSHTQAQSPRTGECCCKVKRERECNCRYLTSLFVINRGKLTNACNINSVYGVQLFHRTIRASNACLNGGDAVMLRKKPLTISIVNMAMRAPSSQSKPSVRAEALSFHICSMDMKRCSCECA